MKKFFANLILCLTLAACTPTEALVRTAIVQTQQAAPTVTETEISSQSLVQTAVAQTLTPAAATLSSDSSQRLQTALVQTLTSLPPTSTPTPQISPTPQTPSPTATVTHAPYPTITITTEPFIPSGPITLNSVEDTGDYKVRLTWQAEGSFPNGLYVVWSPKNSQPSYPDDYWTYFVNGHTRSGIVDVKQAKTYYFRVCEFDADRKHCINYSNVIQFTVK